MEMPLPGEDVQEAEEEHMKDLCNKYGIAYDCSWILDYPLLG